MEFIKKGWRGDFKLLDLILGSAFCVTLVVGIAIIGLVLIHTPENVLPFLIAIYLFCLPISVWLTVALWRSVRSYHRFWKYGVRAFLIYSWLATFLKWLPGHTI